MMTMVFQINEEVTDEPSNCNNLVTNAKIILLLNHKILSMCLIDKFKI